MLAAGAGTGGGPTRSVAEPAGPDLSRCRLTSQSYVSVRRPSTRMLTTGGGELTEEVPGPRIGPSKPSVANDTSRSTHSPPELGERVTDLRNDVDQLMLAAAKPGPQWYRQVPVLISIIALLLSTATSYYSFILTDRQSDLGSRAELGQLVQRLIALPKENTDLAAKYAKDPGRAANVSALINEENLVLAQQAADVIGRIPHLASAAEYLTVAHALERSENFSRSLELIDRGLQIDADPTTREGLLRLKGRAHFNSGDVALGREALTAALGVWPDEPVWQQARGNAFTELLWSSLEERAGQCREAHIHLSRAGAQAQRLDPRSEIGSQVDRSVAASAIDCK